MRYMPGRFIQHNASTEGPSHLIFLDTETKSHVHPDFPNKRLLLLKLGVARSIRLDSGTVSRVAELVFTDLDELWDWVKGRMTADRPTWLFAHNLAFDLTVCNFWAGIENQEWTLYEKEGESGGEGDNAKGKKFRGIFVPEDPPTIIKCRAYGSKRVLWLVDSFNYYRVPLSDLAKQHGLTKGATLPEDASLAVCEEYCRNDVEILQRSMVALMDFVRRHDLGVWKATIAGQSYAAFRHRFMDHSILPHNDTDARSHERSCYYGGEVGVYFVGRVVPDLLQEPIPPREPIVLPAAVIQGPIYHLDINSLYPSVMVDGLYPTQLVDIRQSAFVCDVLRLPRGVDASAKCILNAKSRPYPIRNRKQLYFGLGRMVTWLCGPELQASCRSGDVESIEDVHIYCTQPIFRSYVKELYSLRLKYASEGNKPFEAVCKTMLNSLYGKFGQKGTSLTPIPEYQCPKGWGMHYERIVTKEKLRSDDDNSSLGNGGEMVECSVRGREIRCVGWNAFQVSRDAEPDASFPCISAWVTAYGRERMRQLRGIAGEQACLYQDTDSLHVTERGLRRLMRAGELHPTKLGKLKCVGVTYEAEYRGIKSYTFDGVRVDAGLKASAVPQADGSYQEEQFARLPQIIGNAPPAGVLVSSVAKLPATHDVRGIVGPDGWVKPIDRGWPSEKD